MRIDWEAAAASPEFKELQAKRRRFVVPATVGFLGWYLAFVLLAGYAEDFMGRSVHEGLTVGYVLALSQFVMVWTLGWAYLRYSERVLDPLREHVSALATAGALHAGPQAVVVDDSGAGRFARPAEVTP